MPPRQKKIAFFGVAAALAAALVLFASGSFPRGKPESKQHVVRIHGMVFQPAVLQISAGDSVTWINEDILPHAVKSTDPANPWESTVLPPRASWTKTFARGGPYFCPYHPPMVGQIAVQARP